MSFDTRNEEKDFVTQSCKKRWDEYTHNQRVNLCEFLEIPIMYAVLEWEQLNLSFRQAIESEEREWLEKDREGYQETEEEREARGD